MLEKQIFIKKTKAFLHLVTQTLNNKYTGNEQPLSMEGPVEGQIYFVAPSTTVLLTIKKEELKTLKKEVYDALPEEMFFV